MGKLEFPVFDADNHLYETEDAFTRHLPAKYEGLFKYVAGERAHEDRRRQRDQRLHPQPHVRRRRAPRRVRRVLRGQQPRRQVAAGDGRQADAQRSRRSAPPGRGSRCSTSSASMRR